MARSVQAHAVRKSERAFKASKNLAIAQTRPIWANPIAVNRSFKGVVEIKGLTIGRYHRPIGDREVVVVKMNAIPHGKAGQLSIF